MPTGAFVMMDALGFKELSRRSPNELREKMHGLWSSYGGWLDAYKKDMLKEGYSEAPEITFLSDTIAIGVPLVRIKGTTRELATYSGEVIAAASGFAGDIQRFAADSPLPMAYRGAISFGEYEMAPPFILGPAVNDAAEHYELGEVSAVWLTPTALDVWHETAAHTPEVSTKNLRSYPVPLKSGASFHTMVTNPYVGPTNEDAMEEWTRSVIGTFHGSMGIQIKKQNTVRLLATLWDVRQEQLSYGLSLPRRPAPVQLP
jgi:hypothetical protein